MRLLAFVTIIAAAVLLAAGLPGTSEARPQGQDEPPIENGLPPSGGPQPSNEITVRFKPGVTYQAISRLNSQAGATLVAATGRHSTA
jgi:hypothetical protein